MDDFTYVRNCCEVFKSSFSFSSTFFTSSFLITGVPSEGLLHGEPGSSAAHYGGFLEDDLGVEKLLHSHAY